MWVNWVLPICASSFWLWVSCQDWTLSSSATGAPLQLTNTESNVRTALWMKSAFLSCMSPMHHVCYLSCRLKAYLGSFPHESFSPLLQIPTCHCIPPLLIHIFILHVRFCPYTFLHMNAGISGLAQKQMSEDNLRHHSPLLTFSDTKCVCYSTPVYSCLDSVRDSRLSTSSL